MALDKDAQKRPATRSKARVAGNTTGGARTKAKSHKFKIDAPVAHDVSIAGSFNDWTPQALKCNAKGIWSIAVTLPPGTYEYKFVVDSEWLEDPLSADRVPSPYGGFNSVCVVP